MPALHALLTVTIDRSSQVQGRNLGNNSARKDVMSGYSACDLRSQLNCRMLHSKHVSQDLSIAYPLFDLDPFPITKRRRFLRALCLRWCVSCASDWFTRYTSCYSRSTNQSNQTLPTNLKHSSGRPGSARPFHAFAMRHPTGLGRLNLMWRKAALHLVGRKDFVLVT